MTATKPSDSLMVIQLTAQLIIGLIPDDVAVFAK